MALILGDGFDHYPTALVLGKWDAANGHTISNTYGRLGTQGCYIFNTGFSIIGQGGLSKNMPGNAGVGFFGVAFFIPSMPISGFMNVFALYDAAGGSAMHMSVMIGADGSIGVGSYAIGNSTGILNMYASSASALVVAGTWYYLEVKAKINSVSGIIEVRLNETVVLTYSGNTRRGASNGGAGITVSAADYFNNVKVGGYLTTGSGAGMYFDDFYYCDDTVTAADPNNFSYLGDVQLQAIYPRAASVSGWTIAGSSPAPTNYQSVNEHSPDDAVTFVKTSVIGIDDLYLMDPVSATTNGIKGLLCNGRLTKDDATARTYTLLVKSGATIGEVAIRTVPTGGYVNQQNPMALNPNTSLAFTVAEVNALSGGIRSKS